MHEPRKYASPFFINLHFVARILALLRYEQGAYFVIGNKRGQSVGATAPSTAHVDCQADKGITMAVIVRLQDPISSSVARLAVPPPALQQMSALAGHPAVAAAQRAGIAAPESKRTISMECEIGVFKSMLSFAIYTCVDEGTIPAADVPKFSSIMGDPICTKQPCRPSALLLATGFLQLILMQRRYLFLVTSLDFLLH